MSRKLTKEQEKHIDKCIEIKNDLTEGKKNHVITALILAHIEMIKNIDWKDAGQSYQGAMALVVSTLQKLEEEGLVTLNIKA